MLKSKKLVVTYYRNNSRDDFSAHEIASFSYIAERIAALLSCDYTGDYTHQQVRAVDSQFYFVPSDTLSTDEAALLRIEGPNQIFGGCVPFSFLADKCITHTLVNNAEASPHGWSPQFGKSVQHVTLRGFSAFSRADALTAAAELLNYGDVRIKSPLNRGGNGQIVIDTMGVAKDFLLNIDEQDCREHGVVLESNLNNETTRSIGTVTVGNIQISYCGNQFTTKNTRGESVYGGSSIRAVRGTLNDLLDLNWSQEEVIAIAQAMIYDFAADRNFDGFYASRRNYDVAQGYDRDNQFCSGVLEQSWRIGGASPAEIAAIEAFATESELISVSATCREVHAICEVPENSSIYFRGADADVGHITKFVQTDAHEYGKRRR